MTDLTTGEYDESNGSFEILDDPCSITVTSPNGGEEWMAGTSHTIGWNSSGECGSSVKIELLRNGFVCKTIASSTFNDGSYSWTASRCGTYATDYQIRVTALSASQSDDSNSYFMIPDEVTLTLYLNGSTTSWDYETNNFDWANDLWLIFDGATYSSADPLWNDCVSGLILDADWDGTASFYPSVDSQGNGIFVSYDTDNIEVTVMGDSEDYLQTRLYFHLQWDDYSLELSESTYGDCFTTSASTPYGVGTGPAYNKQSIRYHDNGPGWPFNVNYRIAVVRFVFHGWLSFEDAIYEGQLRLP